MRMQVHRSVMRLHWPGWMLVAIIGNVLLGCSQPDSPSPTRPAEHRTIRAIATVGMVADMVRAVGAEHVEITQLMGTGVDPHLYKPTRDDIQTLMDGDVIFYVGLHLEGKMSDVLARVSKRKPAIAVGESLPRERLIRVSQDSDHVDPHVWMDVGLWMECLPAVVDALAQLDPDHAADFQSRADAYRANLAALDAYGKATLATIPSTHRLLITSHDAFEYFGRAYGLEVQGVQGISTESEAGLQQVNALVSLIVTRNLPAVFVESSVPRKSIEAVMEGARAQGGEVKIGGQLFSDAMGAAGTYEGTYEGMLDHNMTTVTRSLGGQVPPRGFRGRLAVVAGEEE